MGYQLSNIEIFMSKSRMKPKKRVLVAADKRVKKARQSGKRIGYQYGYSAGSLDIARAYNRLGFLDRLQFLFKPRRG